MSQPTNPRWLGIPPHKRIRILEDSGSFVVIEKPANLRSVPGHATQENTTTSTTKNRRTAHEAWIMALDSFSQENTDSDVASQFLKRLTTTMNKSTIPRKKPLFHRYLERSQKRLGLPEDPQERDNLSTNMFDLLVARQRPLMNLPKETDLEESAFGQLQLLLHDDFQKNIRAVHRLDCQTSGVMVFAKTPEAASFLSHAWRERDQVTKRYIALVKNFSPHLENGQTEGIIELPMEPSSERLKWQVASSGGKESITKWRLIDKQSDTILLDLQPITGRTHQLRVHCAHVGNGIVGDSLYGDTPWNSELDLSHPDAPILHLHAWKLSFPDPCSKEFREYTSYPLWYEKYTDISREEAAPNMTGNKPLPVDSENAE